jgi:hypothetical protein
MVIEWNIKELSGKSYSLEETESIKKNAASKFRTSEAREEINKYISKSFVSAST